MADNPHAVTEEQKIKARKALLFDAEPVAAGPVAPSKPFAAYLRETPAAPLATPIKAGLWAVGALVLLLLVGAVLRFSNGPARAKTSSTTESSVQK